MSDVIACFFGGCAESLIAAGDHDIVAIKNDPIQIGFRSSCASGGT